jgi:hypothetical protein
MIEGHGRIIDWQDDDYAVIDGNAKIGRIYRTQIPAGDRWMWFLQITGAPANGATDTLDEAKSRNQSGVYAGARSMMAKLPKPDVIALTVRERILLFCVASGTDWQRAGVLGETVTEMIVKGLVMRDALGRLTLTERGRTTLRALLRDL